MAWGEEFTSGSYQPPGVALAFRRTVYPANPGSSGSNRKHRHLDIFNEKLVKNEGLT